MPPLRRQSSRLLAIQAERAGVNHMRTQSRWLYPRGRRRVLHLAVLALLTLPVPFTASAANLPGLNVIGVAADGTETGSLPAYRWLVEKDKTYHVQTDVNGTALPTIFDPNWDQLNDAHPGGETLSVGFHQSYMPVVAKGCVGWEDVVGANPADSCANDVIPATGYRAKHSLLRLRRSPLRLHHRRRVIRHGRRRQRPANQRLRQRAPDRDGADHDPDLQR